MGSYEKGVEELVALGGYTVECIHTVGVTNVIYSTYDSTISKLEHLSRFGVWGGSYNDLVRYFKEAQAVRIDTLERTDSSITISVTDDLDDYMFNHALTIKVDIPDSWTSVSVSQNGVDIPLVAMAEYSKTKNMSVISCAIEDGYLYVDVIPDGGNVVITAGDKNSNADYQEKVIVSFEPGEGLLESDEYETRVVVGGTIASLPTPERYGFKFIGWYTDDACTVAVDESTTYAEDTILYAGYEALVPCKDGSFDHRWGGWAPSTDGVSEVRVCLDCKTSESRPVEE